MEMDPRLSSRALSTLQTGMVLVTFLEFPLFPGCSFTETLKVVFPGSQLSLPRVQALMKWMSIFFVSRVFASLGRCQKVIFVSIQLIIRLCWVNQSYPSTNEYSSSKFITKNYISCFSPVENVIGICTFFFMDDIEDLSNILNGMGFGKYE